MLVPGPEADSAASAITATGIAPRLGIVLGSGLSALADGLQGRSDIGYATLPGFPTPGVAGHAGIVSTGTLGGLPVALLQGRSHYYESGRSDAMKVPICALAAAGCEALLLTCSAGSVHTSMPSGSLMCIEDHIALGARNPLVGDAGGPRFVDMNNAYDATLRQRLAACAAAANTELHSGVYAWFSGPSFETPAEIRAARVIGADAVGMSVVPETILARDCGLLVVGVAVITNLAAGLAAHGPSHDETLESADKALGALCRLVESFCTDVATNGMHRETR